MKIFFLLTIIFMSQAFAGYTCTKSVDKQKVILFLDTNNAQGEVEEAMRAACERGESFLHMHSMPGENSNGIGTSHFEKRLKTELAALAKRDVAVTSIIGSGHNGGGNLHGEFARVTKAEIISSLKKAYQGKEKLLEQFNSVYMWGCWSMGPAEISVWRHSFPSLKFAAGFIGSAPLAQTAASPAILYDLLKKEKKLLENTDQKKLKRELSSVAHLMSTYGAVYAEASCGDMYFYNAAGERFLSADANPLLLKGSHFVEFDKNFDCHKVARQIDESREAISAYLSGKEPIPADGPDSRLREIYSFARSYSHCIDREDILNADRVGLLRFFDGVKDNFANTYKSLLPELKKEMKILDTVLLSETLTDPTMKSLAKYYKANKNKFFYPTAEILKTKSRAEINQMVSFLTGLHAQAAIKNSDFDDNLGYIWTLENVMDIHLYQVNPFCMSFLEWHEYRPGVRTSSRCW